jgi:lipopolysaccharide transport system ATP-binding protein
MGDAVISVTGLGKRYRIGARRGTYGTLRESLAGAAASAWRGAKALLAGGAPGGGTETFWALKDVSFEVRQGEVLGIIGRNGAGKSTLLKILSRITEPTEGRAVLQGRVGSLLEVGTGFHPELTGRENIYLSGAILGMRKAEIAGKFDAIVEFAGVEQFLDTPAKHYSSGMYVRLGFAVAAHLPAEILVIDEVLAVGDAEFQKRCLGKMGEVSKSGRTVLFVSHNMAAVSALCSRAVVLSAGKIVKDGKADEAVSVYMASVAHLEAEADLSQRKERQGEGPLRFRRFRVLGPENRPVAVCKAGDRITFALDYVSDGSLVGRTLSVAIGINRSYGDDLFTCVSTIAGAEIVGPPQEGTILCTIPRLPVAFGRFSVTLFCTVDSVISDWVQEAGILDVEEGDFFGTGRLPPRGRSSFLVDQLWAVEGPSPTNRP